MGKKCSSIFQTEGIGDNRSYEIVRALAVFACRSSYIFIIVFNLTRGTEKSAKNWGI